jgi:transposase
VVEELRESPEERRVCPQCGTTLSPSDTEDSEQIEIEVRAYRRLIRRRRYQRTCTCANCPRTVTAPPAPELIPKGLSGVSVWVEILLDEFVGHRPTERSLSQWRSLGLDVAAGTVAGGLERLEPLFEPLYDALLTRSPGKVKRDIAGGSGPSWARTRSSFASTRLAATKCPRATSRPMPAWC